MMSTMLELDCGLGQYQDGDECKYAPMINYILFEVDQKGCVRYTSGGYGIGQCVYPKVSYIAYSSYIACTCDTLHGINLNIGTIGICILSAIFFIVFLLPHLVIENKTGKWNWKIGLNLMAYTAIPALDAITNAILLLNSTFGHPAIYGFAVLFYFLPMTIFAYQLWRDKAPCKFPFLSVPSSFFFQEYDNFFKVVITGLLSFPFFLVNAIVVIPWFCIGYFFFLCKILCIGKVQRYWYGIWTGQEDARPAHQPIINRQQLNEQYLSLLILESTPFLFVQITNLAVLDFISPTQYLSIILSTLMIVSGIYRYGYYFCQHKRKIAEVPIPLTLFFLAGADYDPESDNPPIEEQHPSVDIVSINPLRRTMTVVKEEELSNKMNAIEKTLEKVLTRLEEVEGLLKERKDREHEEHFSP